MAVGTFGREDRGDGPGLTHGLFDSGDLRDDFSAFLHMDKIPDADVHQGHLVGVVESRSLDHGPGQQHRVEIGYRGHGARPSDLIVDRQQFGHRFLGLELVGYCPARELGREAQKSLAGHLVDLDDYSVGGVWEGFPGRVPIVYVFFDFVDVVAYLALVRNRQSP